VNPPEMPPLPSNPLVLVLFTDEPIVSQRSPNLRFSKQYARFLHPQVRKNAVALMPMEVMDGIE